MKAILFWFLTVFYCLPTQLIAQPRLFTLEEAVVGQWRKFQPENMAQLAWRPGTHSYAWVKNQVLLSERAESPERNTLILLSDLNRVLKEKKRDTLRTFPAITWETEWEFRFQTGSAVWLCDLRTKNLTLQHSFDDTGENFTRSPNGDWAYTIEHNLSVLTKGNEFLQVTRDADKNIINGQTVSRNEFGIDGGIFWSPRGNFLAFYRKDETQVATYPLVETDETPARLEAIKYPMAGGLSEKVSIGIFNLRTASTVFLETGEPSDQYLTCVTWSPDEKYVFTAHLNRAQNHLQLKMYSAESGKLIRTLLEERHEKYIEPEDPMIFIPGKPDEFLWFSERDGYKHLYHYTLTGELKGQVTRGSWIVTAFLGFSADGRDIFFESTEPDPRGRYLYRGNLKTGKITAITKEPGTHRILFSDDHTWFIDQFDNLSTPRIINLCNTKGEPIRQLVKAANPFEAYDMPSMEQVSLKAGDQNTDLFASLIKPLNFDPSKKYPAIVYVYGGPHAQLVTNSWLGGAMLWEYYMAQQGYVVFTLDNRGSEGRGLGFENQIFRQCGVVEMQDQVKGIEYLKSLGYVDPERIGVHGWSYGGFMTTSLMTTYPNLFKVGVAGGPVINWKWYEVMYGERYMDTPAENPEGYASTDLVAKVPNLKGKLLIIHGALDNTVVWQHSLSFVNECIQKNVPVDYFVYPSAEHNVRGLNRVHLMEKVTRYFDDYLK